MALFVYSEAMTCCRAFINNKKIRRQDMGRIKRVREFGDPDYIRIDQAVFKFNCCEDAVRSIAKQCDAQRKVANDMIKTVNGNHILLSIY